MQIAGVLAREKAEEQFYLIMACLCLPQCGKLRLCATSYRGRAYVLCRIVSQRCVVCGGLWAMNCQ